VYRSVDIHFEDGSLVNAISPADLSIHPGDWCVVDCNRIPEFGQVIQLVDQDGDLPKKGLTPCLMRRATLQDQARAKENSVTGRMAAKTVHKRVEEQKLPVHIVQVRYSFDRSVLHITFTAEDRVDTGEFVKGLAGELRVRIELKPLGVRDAARLVGGMGVCGRPLCCKTWIKEFEAVSVKMAKIQHLALNPGSISGMCGRLKCCLKYEVDNYRELGDNLPRDGARPPCEGGCGCGGDKGQEKQS
jgi:cell fate regulator YaaT (PSP1 superfamily)